MSDCEKAVRSGELQRGIEICRAAHAATGDPRDLSWAAQAYMYLGNYDKENYKEARKRAEQLLASPLYGEANRILSFVAFRDGRGHDARGHAELASVVHRLMGDERSLTSDLVHLAQATWKIGDFTASLDAADEAALRARRLSDPRNEAVAELARADALRRMGDTQGAANTLASALKRATVPCDVAWLRLKKGMRHMEARQESLAELELAMAEQANGRCENHVVAAAIAINQAWLLRWRDPARALALLDRVDKIDGEIVETQLLRGYLAADRGALDEAGRYLERAAGLEPPDADWPWEIARAQAELAELRDGRFDDLLAEHHYRRAMAMVAALRGNARARAAYLVSSHRGPYDGLIGLLAQRGRWRDVLAVILELDASDMLRATAAEVVLHDAVPPEPGAPGDGEIMAAPPEVDDVLAAWRGRELVIVIAPSQRQIGAGRERAYRLRIRDGEITGEDVGPASTARRWAEDLFIDPGNDKAARALGPMIVPPGSAGEALHVLGIGPLGKVPLAALRDAAGAPIIAGRPLVRMLALRASGPASRGMGAPVVIADPGGNLRGAAMEGSAVAAVLGPRAQVAGAGTALPATRAQLWAARDAELLHVAVHVVGRGDRRALQLADAAVETAELVRERFAPRFAVLAGCGSAAAMDEEGWGSIAAALLESGTAAVLATDRSIDDAAALAVMHGFYAQPDWRADPARALARVQRALDMRAATPLDPAAAPRVWAAFSVLGRPPVVAAAVAQKL
ncbi:MAG TPA: CHAT domain-containing protein [Kofleriaceae bacterium]|nr:CHAT domain-containing protein [Kofleriaceae bacterium]